MTDRKRKMCSSCGEELPLTDFHANASRKDGLSVYCKMCERERVARYRATDKGRENGTARNNKWSKANRQKRRAHKAVSNALECGELEKMACAHCGNPDTQAHHEDYSRPLDVVWLCTRHHAERHVEIKKKKQKN